MSLKIGNLRLQPNLSGTNELSFDFVSSCQPLARLIPHLHYGDVIMGAIASQITSITIVYSTFYSDADQRKHQSSASLAFERGIHRGPVNSPHKWPVTQKMLPFDDVIIQTWFGWPERKGSAWVVKDSHRLSWRWLMARSVTWICFLGIVPMSDGSFPQNIADFGCQSRRSSIYMFPTWKAQIRKRC